MSENRRQNIRRNFDESVERRINKHARARRMDGQATPVTPVTPTGGIVDAASKGKFILNISKLDGSDVLG